MKVILTVYSAESSLARTLAQWEQLSHQLNQHLQVAIVSSYCIGSLYTNYESRVVPFVFLIFLLFLKNNFLWVSNLHHHPLSPSTSDFLSISCFTPLSSSPSPSPRVSLPSLSLLLLLQLQLSSVLYMILSLSLLPQESLPVGSWDRETSPGDWNLPQTGRRTKDCIWEKRNHLLWLLPAVVSPVCTTEYLRTFASNTFC